MKTICIYLNDCVSRQYLDNRGNSLSPASARACPREVGGQALAKARDVVVKLFNRQL